MRKQKWAAVLAAALLTALLPGCGGMSASNDMIGGVGDAWANRELGESFSNGSMVAQVETPSSVYRNPDAKLIREAELNLQTMEFDQAVEQLQALVEQLGGYFQSASLSGGSYRNVNANRSGDYVIRVPAEQYDTFLNQSGDLGYVTYRNETTENVGEQYYDTQTRLTTQKTKQERLLELLSKAGSMEDIIALESALSDVEYEIEQLSSTLNRYDSLVGFSTIYLHLNEVHQVNEQTGVADSLLQRIGKGFASSASGLVEGVQELLVWCAYHVFALVIAAAALVGGAVCWKRRRKQRRTPPKNEVPIPDDPEN